jgi:N-acyl-phosphatidylethanolamine-hydrolysing phospholipase D
MCHQHMNPQEAVQVHIDLQARQSLGVHWGTFLMSDEDYMDPKREFEKARIESNLDADCCFTSHIGETVILRN